jgi:hypothetical protein
MEILEVFIAEYFGTFDPNVREICPLGPRIHQRNEIGNFAFRGNHHQKGSVRAGIGDESLQFGGHGNGELFDGILKLFSFFVFIEQFPSGGRTTSSRDPPPSASSPECPLSTHFSALPLITFHLPRGPKHFLFNLNVPCLSFPDFLS